MPITRFATIEFDGDHEVTTVHFSGGVKAWTGGNDEWFFGPILHRGKPALAGVLRQSELRSEISQMKLVPIVYERRTSIDGATSVMWKTADPIKVGDHLTATDVWGTISTNLKQSRLDRFLERSPNASREEIVSVLGRSSPEERFSDYISDSLRCIDICIGAICSYYNEQLISFLVKGRRIGERSSSVADLPFIANVHSFFLHLGSARDYLAALIAHRCGLSETVDAMSRLIPKLSPAAISDDMILRHLLEIGYLATKDGSSSVKAAGWLENVSKIRNELIHKRPFGSHQDEKYGQIEAAGESEGRCKFRKPIHVNSRSTSDTLDFISEIYRNTTRLFGNLAIASGYEAKIPIINRKDIIRFSKQTGKPAQ